MLLNQNEKDRLLRLTPGANTDDVVEELFSMAQDTERVQVPQGLDVTPADPLKPPITGDLPNNGTDQTLFQFTRGNEVFSFGITANNGLTFNGFTSTPGGSGGGGSGVQTVFPGNVMAYLGANQYTVNIYPKGITEASVEVTATQLEGDPAFPHRADGTRWTFVVKAGTNYYVNMPVWKRHA